MFRFLFPQNSQKNSLVPPSKLLLQATIRAVRYSHPAWFLVQPLASQSTLFDSTDGSLLKIGGADPVSDLLRGNAGFDNPIRVAVAGSAKDAGRIPGSGCTILLAGPTGS